MRWDSNSGHCERSCAVCWRTNHEGIGTGPSIILKGSYDVAKKNIILCIWCNAMFTRFEVKKTHYFPHTVHYCCSFMLRLFETHRFLQSLSFWEARCALIGQLSSVLWLAEYLKHETEMFRPLPCCDAVSRSFYSQWSWCDETKTIKPAINEAFVAFSEDIIADYNDPYGLFMHCATPCRVNITPCLHLWS